MIRIRKVRVSKHRAVAIMYVRGCIDRSCSVCPWKKKHPSNDANEFIVIHHCSPSISIYEPYHLCICHLTSFLPNVALLRVNLARQIMCPLPCDKKTKPHICFHPLPDEVRYDCREVCTRLCFLTLEGIIIIIV